MNEEERELCNKLVLQTKSGEITWKRSGCDSFSTNVDDLVIQVVRYTIHGYCGSISYYYYLYVTDNNEMIRLEPGLRDLWPIWKLDPITDLFVYLNGGWREQANKVIKNRIVSQLAAKMR